MRFSIIFAYFRLQPATSNALFLRDCFLMLALAIFWLMSSNPASAASRSVHPFESLHSERLTTSEVKYSSAPITGVVYDASTGAPMNAATVQIEGTYRGTITNEEGEFVIRPEALPATLIIRFIGYESVRVDVAESDDAPLRIALNPVSVTMEEIVVTDEDPALRIMREVIARKQIWRDMLDSYVAEAYSRQRLENDTGIVSITESVSKVFWDRRRGSREVLLNREQTSNIDPSQNFAGATLLPNFYDDNISISGFDLVGVTNPNALRYYYFKLEGFRELDGRTVYDISVKPRRRLQPTFEGRIAVLGEVYALLEVDLRPGESVMFPPPIQEFGLWYRQQFSNFGGDFWLPVDVRIEGTVKFGFPGLQFPPVNFHQMSRISNYTVNVQAPDTLFNIPNRLISANALPMFRDTLGTSAVIERQIPLDGRESVAYASLDSTKTLEEAFQPTGALSRFVQLGDYENESRRSGRFGKIVNGVTPEVAFNRVDALKIGINYRPPLKTKVRPAVMLAYNTGPETLDYGLKATYRITPSRGVIAASSGRNSSRVRPRPLNLEAGYLNQSRHHFHESNIYPLISSGSMLAGSYDYFDYYRAEKVYVTANRRLPRNPFPNWRWEAGLEQVHYTSMEKVTNYSFPGGHIQRENPPVYEGMGRYLVAGLHWGSEAPPFGVTGGRNLELHVQHSGSWAGSDFDFTRLRLEANWRGETFLRRRFMPNTLDMRLIAGTIFGNPGAQHLLGLDTSLGYFTPFGGFRAARQVPYLGDRQIAFFWEHNFRATIFEAFGWYAPTRNGVGWIVHGGHGYTRSAAVSGTGTAVALYPSSRSGIHHEVGISLNGIFSVIRLDATFRLDQPGFFAGMSIARIF